MTYAAPLRDLRFVLEELVGMDAVAALPGADHVNAELVAAVLEEAGRFAADVLAPLNAPGDKAGARWDDGAVTTAPGFADAYRRFVEGGWNALSCNPEHGGQGLPKSVAAGVEEMWNAANMSFALCPLLTRGAIEALELTGSDAQKALYLPKLIEGSWTGTMNLTEPQAGSDLAAVRTRATPDGEGRYRIQGQKIYITYGEHDMAENIVHLVLARLPDAPAGVKGISLFVVPKFIPDADGRPGARNDIRCVSIEHKLGIKASPTAVLAYGDAGGALGELVGEANRGLEYMFIMMNNARFQVGLQGLAIAERAFQQARAYARDRVQGTEAGVRGGGRVPIIRHADVRRMLMEMKARIEAMRALGIVTAHALDLAQAGQDAGAQARADLLIPIVKGWFTEQAGDIASLGVQIHGGMGFIEETGAAQHLRDARILPIYEGTTGIQANDLIGRKVARDGGRAAHALAAEMRATAERLPESGELAGLRAGLLSAVSLLNACTDWMVATYGTDIGAASAGAVPYLKLFGTVAGGWQTARAAMAAAARLEGGDNADRDFHQAKIGTAQFYAAHVLAQAGAYAHQVMHGAPATFALTDDQIAA
ncbi:acyl-CoA dehydrogenase [Acidisphaera rubrifaciens]|uniref:3-methylmercaptopropionyl-CoA dehydrogenase n=1 Tax=Acidisphaera rubrifaciens HS-AP3 TaxID=1231350 RepID=A0A0D6P6P3_9PROT|nr:acyl-CoA dehydrogenase [Acidisphaera rubrifaciens]GAN76868.1 acyl-CoA dehydrogenase [Acidisphaera rubrifaciens HS-AP3]